VAKSAANEPRRPPGIFVTPKTELPAVQASTKARGRVALREPIERSSIEVLLGRFFHTIESEDTEAIVDLFSHDAMSLEGNNWFPGMMGPGAGSPLLVLWRQRLESRGGLGALRGLTYVDYDAMDRETPEEVQARDRTRGAVMRPGDELVRVPIVTPRGAEGLLGTAFVFLLRRTPEGLRIAGIAEENAP